MAAKDRFPEPLLLELKKAKILGVRWCRTRPETASPHPGGAAPATLAEGAARRAAA